MQAGNWSETGIGIVYFSGLAASLLLALIVIYYIRSKLQQGLPIIVGRKNLKSWARAFKITALFGTLSGAMSVSFYGCWGLRDYKTLLESRYLTLRHGLWQVSHGAGSLALIMAMWLLFLIAYLFFIGGDNEREKPLG